MNLVEMKGIRKSFFSVEVLHGVDFSLEAGTVHALVGENGAGKSTLMKVLSGMHKCDVGEIFMGGKPVSIDSPATARELGIAMIHQELSAELEMTVAENIFLGREPCKHGFVDFRQMNRQTQELLGRMNIQVNPRAKMKQLRVADQQMVEIAKAVFRNARVVIMDEPTSSITDREVDSLFRIIQDLKKQGAGIIYISHKMDEVFRIADEISVLRDGANVNTWKSADVDSETVIRSMVGRELTAQFPKREVPITDTVLKVSHLTRAGEYEDISFELHRGEILGFVGLVGSGRTELMRSLCGMTRPESGEVFLDGKKTAFKTPKEAIRAGIAYVTEDRKGEGLVLPMSVGGNITLPSLADFVDHGLLSHSKEDNCIHGQIRALEVKVNTPRQLVKSLSGGNQQKVVLAKWMTTSPRIIIFDEPTRGIDVGAKSEIYKIMCDYVAQGNAVIMVSSEMPEAIGISDRIIVLSNHRCSGELERKDFSQEAIVQYQFQYM